LPRHAAVAYLFLVRSMRVVRWILLPIVLHRSTVSQFFGGGFSVDAVQTAAVQFLGGPAAYGRWR
jgi:hypothetical protein